MTKQRKKSKKRKRSASYKNDDTEDLEDPRPHEHGPSCVRMCFDVVIDTLIYVITLPCKIPFKIMSCIAALLKSITRNFQKFRVWIVNYFYPNTTYSSNYRYHRVDDAEDPKEILYREPIDRKKLIELEIRLKQNEVTMNKLTKEKEDALSRIGEHEDRIQIIKKEKEDALLRMSEESKLTINVLKKDKEDALSRLSELMGAKLRDNNPAITNLNDPNRPMKLGDQFSELYENEWTDSYTDLLDSKELNLTEEKAIAILLNIVQEVYKVCLHDVAEQLSGQRRVVNGFSDDEIERFMKAVKDAVKSQAGIYVPLLCKKVANDMTSCATVAKYKKYSLEYVENCVKICYFAVVQDPPMYIDFVPDHVFDKQMYKEYTKSGTIVDFLVWPALYLHKGGPVLCKGVVQPK